MVSPINYILDVKDPIEEAMRGYAMGRQDIEQRQIMGVRENQEGRAQETFAMQKEDRARAIQQQQARAAEVARQRARAEAGNQALLQYYELQKAGKATPNDLREAMLNFPKMTERFSALAGSFSAERTDNEVAFGRKVLFGLENGQTEAVAALFQERIDAAPNDAAKAPYQAQLLMLEDDPDGLSMQIRMPMITLDKGFDEFSKQYLEKDDEVVAGVSPIGKIAQDVNAGLVPKSVLDSAISVEKEAADGGLTLQQQISEEARLRGEYNKRTEDLVSARTNFNIIEVSAADQTGAGDIALVTSFMKMLDPGSVVRETEFATAANTGGLLARLKTTVTKIEDGKFLSPDQRLEFQNLASKYLGAAQDREAVVQSSYGLIVDNYGLNPVNVFGSSAVPSVETEEPEEPVVAGAAFRSFSVDPSVIKTLEENPGATAEAIWEILTPVQRSAYE